LLTRLDDRLPEAPRVCDFGAYPGTTLRLLRQLFGYSPADLFAAGFAFDDDFVQALSALKVPLLEMEFDVRRPLTAEAHILNFPLMEYGGPFDIAICTEVFEHQMYPLSLLVGLNRFLNPGGTLFLTTNSASFLGGVLKLAVGRHDVEELARSHVLRDYPWRPHIRLYLREEIRQLLEMTGFDLLECDYFDNGNVYKGVKGAAISILRHVAGSIPHLRSHIWVTAVRVRDPEPTAKRALRTSLDRYGIKLIS